MLYTVAFVASVAARGGILDRRVRHLHQTASQSWSILQSLHPSSTAIDFSAESVAFVSDGRKSPSNSSSAWTLNLYAIEPRPRPSSSNNRTLVPVQMS